MSRFFVPSSFPAHVISANYIQVLGQIDLFYGNVMNAAIGPDGQSRPMIIEVRELIGCSINMTNSDYSDDEYSSEAGVYRAMFLKDW